MLDAVLARATELAGLPTSDGGAVGGAARP
jgi:hypothetical protein